MTDTRAPTSTPRPATRLGRDPGSTRSVAGRVAYREELTLLAAQDPRIVCIEADLGGENHPFARAHPDRFLNMGIAEAAAVDIAVGLAAAGLRPFVSTFASFGALRAAESLKLGLGYIRAPVVLVCPYGGVAGGWFGTTHHALEDLAVVGSLPGVRIAVPCGERETRAVIRESLAGERPCYVRLARNEHFVSDIAPVGRGGVGWITRPADGERCLVSVGEKSATLCQRAVARAPGLGHAQLCWVDEDSLREAAAELVGTARRLVVVEEHRAAGGVASALALLRPEARVFGVNAGRGWSSVAGSHDDVLAELGITVDAVLDTAAVNAVPNTVTVEAR